MVSLQEIAFKPVYRSTEDNILAEFYTPCLGASIRYDRAVGFFSSAVLDLVAEPVIDFAIKGGKLRIVASPVLADEDILAIERGTSVREAVVGKSIIETLNWVAEALPNGKLGLQILATLIAKEALEIRICYAAVGRGLYHEKLGLFSDKNGHFVVFHGSCNETSSAWSHNGESFDVFTSWTGENDSKRIESHREYFERLWAGKVLNWATMPLPSDALEQIRQWSRESLVEFIDAPLQTVQNSSNPIESQQPGIKLRPHQSEAIRDWRANENRGILEHATGAGKTIVACTVLRDWLESDICHITLIVVPTQVLQRQWNRVLRSYERSGYLEGVQILLVGGGHAAWQDGGLLSDFTRPDPERGRVVLAILNTASGDEFLKAYRGGPHVLLIVDEVHTAGAPEFSKLFRLRCGPRLGLSATPHRYGDPTGTAAILDFMGPVVHKYTLEQAIADGFLLPYYYDPVFVRLEPDELGEYEKLSRQIVMSWGPDDTPSSDAELLLIRRARVIKKAQNKIARAVELIAKMYSADQRWLVYCEDTQQLCELEGLLRRRLPNVPVRRYLSGMEDDPEQTISSFSAGEGILLSIRCLEAGVDIPEISHALMVASSRNPREFVQRRGRVLRRCPGLTMAYIADVLVEPPDDCNAIFANYSFALGEMQRAFGFAASARNRDAAEGIVERHLGRVLPSLSALECAATESGDKLETNNSGTAEV